MSSTTPHYEFVVHTKEDLSNHGGKLPKRKRACKEWKPAVDTFDKLAAASGEERCAEWKAAADAANAARDMDPAAMDVYDVSAKPRESHRHHQLLSR